MFLAQRMVMGANWKLVYYNAGDGYHNPQLYTSFVTPAHRAAPRTRPRHVGLRTSAPDDCAMYTQALGNGH